MVLDWRTIEGVVQNDTFLQRREQSPWCSDTHIGVAGSLHAVPMSHISNIFPLFII